MAAIVAALLRLHLPEQAIRVGTAAFSVCHYLEDNALRLRRFARKTSMLVLQTAGAEDLSSMSAFTTFFKEPIATLGVFYPMHYIIATFPTYSAAKNAYQALRNIGYSEEDVMLATSEEVLAFFEHFREDAGLVGATMRPVSRFFGTEALFGELDIDHAKEKAGFLAIHSLTDQETQKIRETVKPFAPGSMEWYLPGGIQSLV
jgi:hypothetical protein